MASNTTAAVQQPSAAPAGGRKVASTPAAAPRPKLLRVPSDYPTPQDAIDHCEEGDCVFLAPHEYHLQEPLRIAKSIHMMGDNETGERAKLVFHAGKLRPSVPLLRITSSCRLQGIAFETLVDDETQDALKATSYTVHATSGDVLISDCQIATPCSGVFVGEETYCSLTSVGIDAAFLGISVQGKLFAARSAITHALTAVRVATHATATVERTHLFSCGIGVDVRGHSTTAVHSSTITDCETGILVEDDTPAPKVPEIKGNSILKCVRGIYTKGEGCVCDISKNLVERCREGGITIDGGNSFVSSNAVKQCEQAGIVIQEGRPQLASNIVESCTKNGVYVTGAKSLPVLVSNELHRCPGVALYVADSAAPRVESNVFSDNEVNISVAGGLGLYKKNELLTTEQENVLVAQPASSIVFEENDVLGSVMSCGICVTEGAHAMVVGNSFTGTKLTAVLLKGCGATEVAQNEMDPQTCHAGAVVAQRGAVARIKENYVNGLEVTVYSDSVDSTTVLPQHEESTY